MRLDKNSCLTTYFNAFYGKMVYSLRDKDAKTLRDAFMVSIKIENNLWMYRKLINIEFTK